MRRAFFLVVAALISSPLDSAPSNGPTASPCYLSVSIPVGGTLLVNGARTEQMTAQRRFVSPPLPFGQKFYYTFNATWTQNGEPLTKKKQIEVTAGANIAVDMMQAETVAYVPPKKAVAGSPFVKPEEPKVEKPKKAEPEVPYVPTPIEVVKEMLKLSNVGKDDTVLDLGSGDGRLLIAAVKEFHAKKGLGIAANGGQVLIAEAAAKKAGVADQLAFRPDGEFDKDDYAAVSVVTLNLPAAKLREVTPLLKTLPPGTRIVSHDANIPDWEADRTVTLVDDAGIAHQVYLWTVPKK